MRQTVFGLMRHAQTNWNVDKRIQGRLETELSVYGKDQAVGWGEILAPMGWDRIITSDLGRAMETGRLINQRLNLPAHTDPRLREQDWGRWTTKTIAELRRERGDEVEAQEARGWDFRPPEGESRMEVLGRSASALIEAAEMFPGGKILVVTHQGVLKCLINHMAGLDFLPDEPNKIKGYFVQHVSCNGQGLSLETTRIELE